MTSKEYHEFTSKYNSVPCSFCGKSWNPELYGTNPHYSVYVWDSKAKHTELKVCPMCEMKPEVQFEIRKIDLIFQEMKKLERDETKINEILSDWYTKS